MNKLHTSLNVELDILGQQPLFQNLYTQITLCFPLSDWADQQPVIDRLRTGLKRAADSFPWIVGQTINHGASNGDTGTFSIRPWVGAPHLCVKELQSDGSSPSFDDIKNAGFPMRLLDESALSWRKTFAADDGPREVLSVQAVFVKGGLLLTFTASHATMDAAGQGQVIALVAKACRGEEYSREEIEIGNLARHNLVPLLAKDYTPGAEMSNQISKPTSEAATTEEKAGIHPPSNSWVYFNFGPSSLAEIKDKATSLLPRDSGVPFLSTDDAITAFIWQSVTRSRLPRLVDPSAEVMLTRAVDVRKYLSIPSTYPGLMQNLNFHHQTPQELAQPASLGAVAADLRSALLTDQVNGDGWDLAGRTRALASVLARSADKSAISLTATVNPSKDVMLSSWTMLKSLYEDADFGPGIGKPVAIRRPRFDAVEGLLYLLPAAPEGGIAFAASLRDEDLDRLRQDQDFQQYAVYVG